MMMMKSHLPGIWKYAQRLPVNDEASIVSLEEGNTPLVISRQSFQSKVYLKDETRNPTGSMKDRAISVAVSKAKELGVRQTILASTGNAAISAAAYTGRAGIRNTVLVSKRLSSERLAMISFFGSEIMQEDGAIEDLGERAAKLSEERGWMNISTSRRRNGYQSEAPKTIAYEIYEQLGGFPDYIFIPVGGGGTFNGIWRGFKELLGLSVGAGVSSLPKMIAVHHTHYNSLERAMKVGISSDQELVQLSQSMDKSKKCMATNIQHVYCSEGEEALSAIRESQGIAMSVSDKQIVHAQLQLARQDGIFAEPTAASTLAAVCKAEMEGWIQPQHIVVALVTGSGFKNKIRVRSYKGLFR